MVDESNPDNAPIIQSESDNVANNETEKPSASDGMSVSVTINGNTTYYATFGEAWKVMNDNTSAEVTVTLLDNAIAVNGKFGDYSQLDVNERTAPLTLDLNNFTVNRDLASAQNFGAVFCLENAGQVTIKNGTVKGGNNNYNAGGIFVNNKDITVTLTNLTVEDNYTGACGGGIYVGNAKQLNVNNCLINNNNAVLYGGGIYFSGDTANATLDNDSFTGNYSDINGGAVYIYGSADSKLSFKDLTITGNSTKYGGAGILWTTDWKDSNSRMTSLTLSGKIIVKDNIGSDGNNVRITPYPNNTPVLTLTAMSEESEIWISFDDKLLGKLADGLGTKADTLNNCFHSDIENLGVTSSNGTLSIIADPPEGIKAGLYYQKTWTFFDTFQQAWGTANDGSYSEYDCTLMLFEDWNAVDGSLGEGYFFTGGALTPRERKNDDSWLIFDLNGHTINRGLYDPQKGIDNSKDHGCIFEIGSGSDEVRISIRNGTITGGNNNFNGGAIYYTYSNGQLELINVSLIQNKSRTYGGGIYTNTGLILNNVSIIDNVADKRGGGIHMNSDNGCIYMIGTIKVYRNRAMECCDNIDLAYQCTYPVNAENMNFRNSCVGISKGVGVIRNGADRFRLVDCGDRTNDPYCLSAFFSDEGGTLYIENNKYISLSH